jgi:hypothetical protein
MSVTVHDAAARPAWLDRGCGARFASAIEHLERVLGEWRDQSDDGTTFSILLAACADTGAPGTDPRVDLGRLARSRHDQIQSIGKRIAGVDEASRASASGPVNCSMHWAHAQYQSDPRPCAARNTSAIGDDTPAGRRSPADRESRRLPQINFEERFLLTNISETLE